MDTNKALNLNQHNSSFLNRPSVELGFNLFIESLAKRGFLSSDKQYYYINIWSIGCQPCIEELPTLDSLQNIISQKVSCIMVSCHSDRAVQRFLEKRSLTLSNFILLNGMNDFVLYINNKLNLDEYVFPIHIILNKKGHVLAYLIGSLTDERSLLPITEFIDNLE